MPTVINTTQSIRTERNLPLPLVAWNASGLCREYCWMNLDWKHADVKSTSCVYSIICIADLHNVKTKVTKWG